MSHRGQLSCLNQPVAYHSHTLTPSANSPSGKMAGPQRTASQDSTADGIRKRVCKACDRCRLKKSKCDGASPCSRCKSDNALCVFGERKKSQDKVYPKGYVEMLEDQQAKLVAGLQETYRRLVAGEVWEGTPLAETNGHPLTHDILSALNLLEQKSDGESDTFEEDTAKLQERLIANGAGFVQPHHARRDSYGVDSNSPSESEHSHRGHTRTQSHGTPMSSKASLFKEPYNIKSEAATPPTAQSPAPSQTRSYPTSQPSPMQHHSPLENEAQVWANDYSMNDTMGNFNMMRPEYAMHSTPIEQNLNAMGGMIGQWPTTSAAYNDASMLSYPAQYSSFFGNGPQLQNDTFGSLYPSGMDMDLDSFMSAAA